MGLALSPRPGAWDAQRAHPARRLVRVVTLVRYRFFLYAGVLPYLLGAAWAYGIERRFEAAPFWSGLAGVILAVIGVESFNEYFDARQGSDRVFDPREAPVIADWVLWLGTAAFAAALAIGVSLALQSGWAVLAFAVLGGLAAVFYVAPPVRWAYRGLGETVIALSYGPWMVLGSLYLQTRTLSWGALAASLVPGLLIMALAVVNAIPDFHQDRLVGKRNLVVRLGRRRAVGLYLALAGAALALVLAGVIAGVFPRQCAAALLAAPLLWVSGRRASATFQTPRRFVPAIRAIVGCYLIAVSLFTLGVLLHAGG